MQTGGGKPVVSLEQTVSLSGTNAPELLFNFGFVSQEKVIPNTLLDSFTVTVQNPLTSVSAVLVSIDAGGPVWTPTSPGNLTLSDAQILRQGIPPPSVAPVLGQGVAYAVAFMLPAALIGPSVNVTFDLFDDQSGLMSLGWYSDLRTSSVPEPQVWELLAAGVTVLAVQRRRSR